MIVYDDETLENALKMLETGGVVKYDDEFSFRTITSLEQLERLCSDALKRGDVAIVARSVNEMEEHDAALRGVRRLLALEERRRVKEWLKQHPELAKAKAEEIPAIVKRLRKEAALKKETRSGCVLC